MSSARLIAIAIALGFPGAAMAQGQDSEPWERDLQVIAAMLPGLYSNANQAYFDQRVNRDPKHPAVEVQLSASAKTDFALTMEQGGGGAKIWTLQLVSDPGDSSIRLRTRPRFVASSGNAACDLVWSRSAAEFHATAVADCPDSSIERIVLSEKQLWIDVSGPGGGRFQLHRAREFECYADIPGVGGGRDEPFDRYDGLNLHDQGGSVWFTSKEGRELGISMLLVDWPINNFDNAFARDSLVVYLSEEANGERKELGYAFTLPEADRIGINLKWILVNCFMQSNEDVTPFM